MKILIVVATEHEISHINTKRKPNVDVLITGIGSPATILKLNTLLISKSYDLIINIGIAGSFHKNINIGEIVHVQSETFADLGFESSNSFIPISKSSFSDLQNSSFSNSFYLDYLEKFKKVNGITVNSSSGNITTINMRKKIFNADIETMEGAAVFYVCSELNIPFFQIRSISNYIEERNPDNWNIPLAIKNLNKELENILSLLNSPSI